MNNYMSTLLNKEEEYKKLHNLIKISSDSSEEYKNIFLMYSKKRNHESLLKRSEVIAWIKKVCKDSKLSNETRDTSIQIYDKYLAIKNNERNIILNNDFIKYSTVTSILLSCKMHETRSLVSCCSFPQFNKNELIKLEINILMTIGFNINASITPTNFIDILLRLWTKDEDLINQIASHADDLLNIIWEDSESMCFSSEILACSLLLKSFSDLRMDINEWISYLPLNSIKYENIDKCLNKYFKNSSYNNNNYNNNRISCVNSPVSITHMPFSPNK